MPALPIVAGWVVLLHGGEHLGQFVGQELIVFFRCERDADLVEVATV